MWPATATRPLRWSGVLPKRIAFAGRASSSTLRESALPAMGLETLVLRLQVNASARVLLASNGTIITMFASAKILSSSTAPSAHLALTSQE